MKCVGGLNHKNKQRPTSYTNNQQPHPLSGPRGQIRSLWPRAAIALWLCIFSFLKTPTFLVLGLLKINVEQCRRCKGLRLHRGRRSRNSGLCCTRPGWSVRHVDPCQCISQSEEVKRGGAVWSVRGNWGRFLCRLRPFDLFVSTMALKALEEAHSLPASSPTLESRPSLPQFQRGC